MDLTHLLISLILIFAGAKVLGEVAGRVGQPAVLGELAAGVILGVGGLKLVNPQADVIVLLADIGVIILLFEAGLATDLQELLKVGWKSLAVALVGVALPFAGGYGFAVAFGFDSVVAIVLGATLTATSVGITARVLSDLGKLGTREAKIILGAAVADDIIGLTILAVVRDLGTAGAVYWPKTVIVAGAAIGFFAAALVVGHVFARQFIRVIEWMKCSGALIVGAVGFALAWALAAEVVGSSAMVGAFAAGLALGRTHKYEEIRKDVLPVAFIFTPIFFVQTGAGVDIRHFNPLEPANHATLLLGGAVLLIALAGKFFAGFAAFDRSVNASAIGLGMAPRGEVGLVFAEVGRRAGILRDDLFAAVVMVIAMTTFLTPPLLKYTLTPAAGRQSLWNAFFSLPRRGVRKMITLPRKRKDDDRAG